MFYFYGRPTDVNYDSAGTKEYILQSMIDYSRTLPNDRTYYLVNNQPFDFNYAHYKEKMEYLLYPKQMQIVEKSTVPELVATEMKEHKKIALLYIDSLPELDRLNGDVVTIHCGENTLIPNYFCPRNWLSYYSFSMARID